MKKKRGSLLCRSNICRLKLSRLLKKKEAKRLFNLYRFSFTLNRIRAIRYAVLIFAIFRSLAPEMIYIAYVSTTSDEMDDSNSLMHPIITQHYSVRVENGLVQIFFDWIVSKETLRNDGVKTPLFLTATKTKKIKLMFFIRLFISQIPNQLNQQ